MMRALVLGASGQVGTELLRALPETAGAEVIAATTRGNLDGMRCERADFRDPASVVELIRKLRPDVVVNAAAYTAVDLAETHSDDAYLINAQTPSAIATTCVELGIPLVHYSTDYVFDGNANKPYPVDHVTSPLGVYGASKLAGEDGIRRSGAHHLILRTAWVYANHGHNFMKTMLRLADKEQLKVVDDQIGCPTPASLIADVTAQIVRRGVAGAQTHHLVTQGETSWAGFADAIFEEAIAQNQIQSRPEIIRIPSSEYPTPAARPNYSVLDTTSLSDAFDITLPHWKDALRETLADKNNESA